MSQREPQRTTIRLTPQVRRSTLLTSECFPAATAGSALRACRIRYHSLGVIASYSRPEARIRCGTIYVRDPAASVRWHRGMVVMRSNTVAEVYRPRLFGGGSDSVHQAESP